MPGKDDQPLIEIKNLSVSFRLYNTRFTQEYLQVISDLSVNVKAGEIMAIAGSSGSGKSILAHAIMGILPDNSLSSGQILYKGEPLTPQRQKELRGRGLALIPQSVTYLDPLMRVGAQVGNGDKSRQVVRSQEEAFRRLDLAAEVNQMYPFQLSGGMARRVLVATALVSDAALVIADEPTPGMDLDLAMESLQCLRELANQGKGVILITHDLDLAYEVADRLAVFYAGTTLEIALAKDFQEGPTALRHPYTKALWQALPQNGFLPIPGFQPQGYELPQGCLFAPRCAQKTEDCTKNHIPVRALRGGMVRCIHAT